MVGLLAAATLASAQTQTVRGRILDADSESPLPGATVIIPGSDPLLGTTSDPDGYFRLDEVPVGRISIEVSFIGYEPWRTDQALVKSGKELVLSIALTESMAQLDAVVIKAEDGSNDALNEMATVSARSFSVDETQRYAGSASDPARMAMNFAGVASAGDDVMNEIVIRGNSPRTIMWRLEGIEIPNPNHFGAMGSSGGGISMLSSSTLGRSDFYTGAFPAEFGNATSGVFDLSLRTGNDEKREHAFQIGLLGVEASTEGYFKKGNRASYLVNYRYSTFGLLSTFYSPLGDVLPKYSDLSFKVNVPTEKAGTFSLFGLGGYNSNILDPPADSTEWEDEYGNEGFIEQQRVGIVGLSHRYPISNNTWLRTVVMGSWDEYHDEYYVLQPENNYEAYYDDSTNFRNTAIRASMMLTHKFDARHTLRFGGIFSNMGYRYDYQNRWSDTTGLWRSYLNGQGNANMVQGFAQWKYRFHEDWTLNAGAHGTLLTLNNTWALEPRAAVEWRPSPVQSISLAVGLHSKPEHPSTYFLQNASLDGEVAAVVNDDLEIPKAAHAVLGYKRQLGENLSVSIEGYYQHLYDLPVSSDTSSTESIVNAINIWDIVGEDSVSTSGQGFNAGVDITMERRFSNRYYIMGTGSVFKSRYRAANGQWYNTRFDRTYTFNMVGGKEFPVGKNGQNTIGLNGKVNVQGGARRDEIDLQASRDAGSTVLVPGGEWQARLPLYYRFDVGFVYRRNRPKTTHSIRMDLQNVTNRYNAFSQYFSSETGNIEQSDQLGLFPFFDYRIEF